MGASTTLSLFETREAPPRTPLGDPLADFTSRLLRHLDRSDQRKWGHTYLAALLSTPGKKSIRRLARSVSASPGVAQSLRQFVSVSTWDWHRVMAELADWAGEQEAPRAWSIRTVLLPKRGNRSVGVHRQFDPLSGRAVSCQVGVTAFLCVGSVCVPAVWQLALPKPWAEDAELRERTRIPDSARYQPLWEQVLALADRLAATTTAAPLVVEMSDDPSADLLVRALARRRRDFAVAVPPNFTVMPAEPVPAGTPLKLGAREFFASGRPSDLVLDASSRAGRPTHILSAQVRLPVAGTGEPGGTGLRLLAERRPDAGIGRTWITALPRHQAGQAASLALLGEDTARAVAELKEEFGLLDFEGRSFPGWHHHMTLASAAYAYRVLGGISSAPDIRPTLPYPRAAQDERVHCPPAPGVLARAAR